MTENSSTALIIDTDVALGVWHDGRPRDIDDGFAVVEAINEPSIELLGITTVYGNAPVEDTTRVARKLVQLKNVDVPVIEGSGVALAQDLDLSDRENVAAVWAENGAADFIASRLTERRLSIAAIGPLTNIATLALKYPQCMSQIDQLVIVAGRTPDRNFYIGDVGPVRDFNFENDVLAMRLALESGVPVVLAGFELTSQVCIAAADLAQINQHRSRTASYLYTNSLDWFHHWTRIFPGEAGFHPWDSATISWLRDPRLFKCEQRGWRIHPATGVSRPPEENPDSSPAETFHLTCSKDFDGPQVTYLTGFATGVSGDKDAKRVFIDEICRLVY